MTTNAISLAVKKAITTGLAAGIPDSTMSVATWAETFRYVDRGARKGKWLNSTVPYLTEIMNCFTDPSVREIVFQKPSQAGGSEVIMNMIGRTIHLDPTDMAYVAEKEDKAKAWTQESFDATVRTTQVLKNLIPTDPEFNNQKVKMFTGGQLSIIFASSPAELSSRPFQYLFFDERAAYIPTREGDPVKLGEARTKTYSGFEKIVKISSPRNAIDDADIEHDFLRGDRREFYVPCPQCTEFQTLKWANLKFGEDDENPFMVCEMNGCVIENDDLQEMLLLGRWIAGAPFNGIASFRINQLYSPFVPWRQMVNDFRDAKARGPQSAQMQVWVNTCLAEPWRPDVRIEYEDLQVQRERYEAPVPAGVLVLTGAVDVQGDRLEIKVMGWGRNNENWQIDYRIIEGSPALPEVWDALTDFLLTPLDGELRQFKKIDAVCIDSGGHHTQQVYRFCKANAGKKWFAIKGSSTPGAPLLSKPKYVGKYPRVRLYMIGTNAAKDEIFGFLKVPEPGLPGFCHFPDDDRYDDAYLRQLCSEKKMPRARMGQTYWIYEKISPNVRNEALDLFVYNVAARSILNPNYEAIARRRLNHDPPESTDKTKPNDKTSDEIEKDATPAPRKRKPRIRIGKNPFKGLKL